MTVDGETRDIRFHFWQRRPSFAKVNRQRDRLCMDVRKRPTRLRSIPKIAIALGVIH